MVENNADGDEWTLTPEGVEQSPRTLGESERQFRLLVQGVTDYAIYMLDPQGRIATWNAGGERIKGYSADDVVGQHFSMFYTPEDLASGEPQRALETARREGRYEKEGLRVRKDGSQFWASVVIDSVKDDDGRLIGFAKITRDVTERRQQAQALEIAQQSMLQAQRMEAIAQLTYGVAHDFNNLLTVITNSLDLIQVDTTDPERIRRLVGGAQRAAQRGAQLTRQLLAFSRRQTLKPEPHNLNSLVGGVETVLRRAVGEDVEFVLSLAHGLEMVDVDAVEFEAALLNLVVNSRDAMPNGGRLVIRTRPHFVPEQPDVPDGPRAGRYACVSVEDTGQGMTPEVRARAAEPFFTTKEVGRGSGLGLSQVFGFAAQSGGFVTIDSSEGVGTTISFCLPVRDQVVAQSADATIKVLLVEDNPDVQLVAAEALRSLGYAVQWADNGTEALDVLRGDPTIDILFTDVVMPKGLSGVDLLEEARKLRPGLKVLLTSGYARGQLPTIPPGCEFIAKPYRVDELARRLRRLRTGERSHPPT